jgi:catechol 2,3-dioxygenase-like lactoylglutathione lyase family enzyme
MQGTLETRYWFSFFSFLLAPLMAEPLGRLDGSSQADDDNTMSTITSGTFVLAVRDLLVARTFYVEKLGFVEDMAVEGWSFLKHGACEIRLGQCPDAVPMSACGDHAWFAYLHVSDAAGLYAEYISRGVPIWHQLEDKPWGFREFGVSTPDGHRIVFGQDLES